MTGRAVVAVHGGASGLTRAEISDGRADASFATLRAALAAAAEVLSDDGTALDAVVAAVRELEDGDTLNAGRGAALTEAGTVELSASVADGRSRGFGGVALVTRVQHPIELARVVLERGRAVLVAGPATEEWARAAGLALVDPTYFVTERQQRALAEQTAAATGTVGAVALDRHGHLAAATSTGGLSGQSPGRIGDSPIVGAGTWADDTTCAISATGTGEVFLRAAFAHEVHARLARGGDDLERACRAALDDVTALGGAGGCVAVDRQGAVAMPFTTPAMLRGVWRAGDRARVACDPGRVRD